MSYLHLSVVYVQQVKSIHVLMKIISVICVFVTQKSNYKFKKRNSSPLRILAQFDHWLYIVGMFTIKLQNTGHSRSLTYFRYLERSDCKNFVLYIFFVYLGSDVFSLIRSSANNIKINGCRVI